MSDEQAVEEKAVEETTPEPEAPKEEVQEAPAPELNDAEDYAAQEATKQVAEAGSDDSVDIFGAEAQGVFEELGLAGDEPAKFTREEIKSWPPELRQVYKQMQQGVQKRFREQADLKKSLAERLKALDERKIAVDSSARDQFKVFEDERLQQYLQKPSGDKPEPWDVDARVRWEVQNTLSEMLGGYHNTMETIGSEHREHVEKQQAVARLEERKTELRQFIKDNSDFVEYQNDIIEFRKEHSSFSPEKAYEYLKLQRGQEKQLASQEQVESALDDSASRTHRAGRSGGASTVDAPPPGLSGAEIARWFEKRPGAKKKYLEKVRSMG